MLARLRHLEEAGPSYLFRSSRLPLRRFVVDGIGVICQKMRLSSKTQHLAVQLLDVFMDRGSEKPPLKQAAICCVALAGKFIVWLTHGNNDLLLY
jgi:hypothetical protein